jgi:hypothetical protein
MKELRLQVDCGMQTKCTITFVNSITLHVFNLNSKHVFKCKENGYIQLIIETDS